MILKTDFLALLCVTVVAIYMLWFTRNNSEPVYKVMKILSAIIAVLWIIAAILYSQQ
jgi:hypothetical protein